jgi:cell fate regulator YaaT (PSP1 superfamily)
MDFEINDKNRLTKKGCCGKNGNGCCSEKNQLNVYDWLSDLPDSEKLTDYVEVQFKNTRKSYYLNSNGLSLEKGDFVAVEASPGHDIGEVTLIGQLVLLQMKKTGFKIDPQNVKRVYRKVRPVDMEKFHEVKAKEHSTMLQARRIAEDLNLEMKIGDVEYQGDGNKAIFYYIANDRVDFRQLIKVLAETFRVRIEMKQIGARQEAGRIGGIGPCGRPLCCSTWMSNFVSVTTGAARYQDISLNPQKLAGQCAKLKCCLNYEVDVYVESQKRLPSREIPLETVDGTYYHFKTDILKRIMTYSTDKNFAANLVAIPAQRVFDIIGMNKKGQKPESLLPEESNKDKKTLSKPKDFQNVVGQDSLTRFDKDNKRKNGGGNNGNNKRRNGNFHKKGNKKENNGNNNAKDGQ